MEVPRYVSLHEDGPHTLAFIMTDNKYRRYWFFDVVLEDGDFLGRPRAESLHEYSRRIGGALVALANLIVEQTPLAVYDPQLELPFSAQERPQDAS